jgi:hypothetical protein
VCRQATIDIDQYLQTNLGYDLKIDERPNWTRSGRYESMSLIFAHVITCDRQYRQCGSTMRNTKVRSSSCYEQCRSVVLASLATSIDRAESSFDGRTIGIVTNSQIGLPVSVRHLVHPVDMRSLNNLLRRSIDDESIRRVYGWLFSRAQDLHRRSSSNRSIVKSKSLFGIFRCLINQYHRHVPIEYLCGTGMFFNRLFLVNRHVLIPRRDSECLIVRVQRLDDDEKRRE